MPTAIARYRHGKAKLERTRSEVVAGWHAIAHQLQEEGDFGLSDKVRYFVARIAPPVTDQEQLVEKILRKKGARERAPPERTR